MASLFSLRLDKQTRRRLTQLARRRGVPTSQVARELIHDSLQRHERTGSLYDRIAHLIGVVHGGDPNRSKDTGRKFSEMLRRRRRGR